MERSVVALGTFDGVHLGHKRIIVDAASYARRKKLHLAAITFDPHPQQFIVPERGLKLLTTIDERKELLAEYGAKKVKVIKFTKSLRNLSDEAFVKKILVSGLNAAAVFVGFDFAFGRGRSGEVKHLKQLGKKYGFVVKVVRPVKANRRAIKSSLIRNLVAHGNFNHAVRLLGHPYSLTGKVVRGTGRGRKLGFPTANLKLDEHKLVPQQGVYAGRVDGRKCVVNIGARPTFGVGGCAIEVHILNYSGNLYGKVLKAGLYRKLRDEIQFADVELLKNRILLDIAISRRVMI